MASAAANGGSPAGRGDVAAHVYLALQSEDSGVAARCVAEATGTDLLVPSVWEQLQDTSPPTPGQEPRYATRGLTAVHVLARDCRNLDLMGQSLARVPKALGEKAGCLPDGRNAKWLPVHVAAMENSSVDVSRLLLDVGGVEQLQATDGEGRLAMHLAAWNNSRSQILLFLQ
jgi:hypothetical protein